MYTSCYTYNVLLTNNIENICVEKMDMLELLMLLIIELW